ncbi:MAG: YbjQ family protein [Proteobacteria bacterium]|nr:YbjQ family protein [Pseudomonadota bacterium]
MTVTEGLHVGLDFLAKWKNVLGGRIKSFEKKTDTAVQAGKEKLRQMAINIGANAIIGLRIVPLSDPVSSDSVITVSMYGTAVKTFAVKAQLQGYETTKASKPIKPGKTGSIFARKKNRQDQKIGDQLGEVRNIGNVGRSL